MRVELSGWVEGDLESIAAYIAADSPRHAFELLKRIRQKILQLGRQPELYRLRPEIGEGARVAAVGRYLILFRIEAEAVRIERVVYGGRELSALFDE
jgi:toxin ParE1/3/4